MIICPDRGNSFYFLENFHGTVVHVPIFDECKTDYFAQVNFLVNADAVGLGCFGLFFFVTDCLFP